MFAAWTDRKAKARWFSGAAAPSSDYVVDFRIGGREAIVAAAAGGAVYAFEATYQDIVAGERIVYAYSMDGDSVRISVSVASMEFRPVAGGA